MTKSIIVAPQQQQLTSKQTEVINKETPPQFIKERKGRGNQIFTYVEIGYVIDELNKIFGHLGWDKESELVPELTDDKFITMKVKLTIKDHKGHFVTKTAFGGVDRKFIKGTKQYVDPGDDAKAAEADGLKKAASHFGIAADIYYPKTYQAREFMETPKRTFYCERCHKQNKTKRVYKQRADRTKQEYGFVLCAECEKAAKKYKQEQDSKKLYAETLKSIRATTDKKGLENLFEDLDQRTEFTEDQRKSINTQIQERIKEL